MIKWYLLTFQSRGHRCRQLLIHTDAFAISVGFDGYTANITGELLPQRVIVVDCLSYLGSKPTSSDEANLSLWSTIHPR